MNNLETEVTEKKPAKRKAAKRKPRAPAAPKPATTGPFAGLTVTDCCDDCGVDGCVISGKPYCAHPRKGGLHSAEISDPAALKRQQQAKRLLGEQMLQARSDA